MDVSIVVSIVPKGYKNHEKSINQLQTGGSLSIRPVDVGQSWPGPSGPPIRAAHFPAANPNRIPSPGRSAQKASPL